MKPLKRWFSAVSTDFSERLTLRSGIQMMVLIGIFAGVGGLALWGGLLHDETVTITATVVESPVDEQPRFSLAALEEDHPVEIAVERAILHNGSGTSTTTRETLEDAGISATTFYVEHHDQMVEVTVETQ